jgi:membrane-associated phospholipid phosphatase
LVFNSIIEYWYVLSAVNIILVIIITSFVVKYESKIPEEKEKHSFLKVLRFWYPVLIILYIFKEIYLLIHPVNPNDIDTVLINMDFGMLGVNPTQWIYRFANPALTELLQIVYIMYYLVIPLYGIELFLKKRYEDFQFSVFVLFSGFYIAYALYFIFPAVGPRFYLHDFYSIEKELPGLFLTNPFRVILNFAESIPVGVPNPQDYVQRDAMPSLHAEIAILLAYLSKKLGMKSFYFYLPYCLLMLLATIYLRYHYAVDLIAGALIALLAAVLGSVMYSRINGEYIEKSKTNS